MVILLAEKTPAANDLLPMNELQTAAFTALFGVITFVVGQITVKLFEPAYDLRAHFGAIARDLLVYANRDQKLDAFRRDNLVLYGEGELAPESD